MHAVWVHVLQQRTHLGMSLRFSQMVFLNISLLNNRCFGATVPRYVIYILDLAKSPTYCMSHHVIFELSSPCQRA